MSNGGRANVITKAQNRRQKQGNITRSGGSTRVSGLHPPAQQITERNQSHIGAQDMPTINFMTDTHDGSSGGQTSSAFHHMEAALSTNPTHFHAYLHRQSAIHRGQLPHAQNDKQWIETSS